jgi:hypothetical protein
LIKPGVELTVDDALAGSGTTVTQVGDIFGVHFSNEKNVALFVVGSGDVLLCSLDDWQDLQRAEGGQPSSLATTLLNLGALSS